ncbi:hypothetical protein [Vibrio ouci]|uniref:Uncharacterized protein n=1 Tax=Vibrio ouci TaxID=2499078 RepID=A0A4Y8WE23_9VIBR|nr:hypothetical protein [Vibrio ouci]TFH90883.1 hypothetical protein ELS82_14230 [Vibrio ouci]
MATLEGAAAIEEVKSVNFSQAHGGIESVSQSMDNSTFLLSAGERVIQPQQNKELSSLFQEQNYLHTLISVTYS